MGEPVEKDAGHSSTMISFWRNINPKKRGDSYTSKSTDISIVNISLNEDEINRGRWSNQAEFIISCIGFAVGLGNVWRFPVKCYENGGAAFLILYLIAAIILGVPLLLVELGIGQFSGRSPTTVFKMVPALYGVGWATVAISTVIEVYYSVVISWAFIYFFGSFQYTMPWTQCNHVYNTVDCLGSNTPRNMSKTYVSSTTEYWDYYVSGFVKYPSRKMYTMDEFPGSPQWHMTLCLLLTWILTGLTVMYGAQVTGKIMYFTVIFPYVALIALTCLGLTLPGAMLGLKFYLFPVWKNLYNPNVILASVEQVFFSTSIAMGGMLTYASFNNFRDNIYRATLIIVSVDCITSIISGFAVFPILGYMAHRAGVAIEKVITSGEGLFYITYTDALATIPWSNLWTIILMIMAVSLGLDSQFAPLDCISTGISDKYPALRATKGRRILFIWFMVFWHFILAIMLCTPGGKYWFLILDSRVSGYGLPIVALLEIIIVGVIYGFHQLSYDFSLMLDFTFNKAWMCLVVFVCPILITLIIIASTISFEHLEVWGVRIPVWGEVIAFIFLGLVLLPIFTGLIHTVITYRKKYPELKGKKFMKKLFSPPIYWGPQFLENWLHGSFYRKKLIKYKENPRFLKYHGKNLHFDQIVAIAEGKEALV